MTSVFFRVPSVIKCPRLALEGKSACHFYMQITMAQVSLLVICQKQSLLQVCQLFLGVPKWMSCMSQPGNSSCHLQLALVSYPASLSAPCFLSFLPLSFPLLFSGEPPPPVHALGQTLFLLFEGGPMAKA